MATRMLCAAACCGSRRGPAAGLTAAPRTVPAGSQEAANSLDQSVWPEKFAFPDHQLCPARPGQQPAGLSVARHVPPALRAPVLAVVHGRTLPATARMNVPKAAMYVDDLAQTRQHDVGRSRQVAAVQPKSKTQPMHESSHGKFRGRVPRLHCCHRARTLCFCQRLWHGYRITMRIPGVPTCAIHHSL